MCPVLKMLKKKFVIGYNKYPLDLCTPVNQMSPEHPYNRAQAECNTEDDRFAVQSLYIKDIVYLFIATVCYDLAVSHDLMHKSMQEVEDWQLSIDLEHRKKQLSVIDGGKS